MGSDRNMLRAICQDKNLRYEYQTMNIVSLVGIAASICTAISLLPQLIKVIREKEAGDVSIWMLIVLFLGLGLWIFYGVIKNDLIIIISNSFSLAVNIILFGYAMKYKR